MAYVRIGSNELKTRLIMHDCLCPISQIIIQTTHQLADFENNIPPPPPPPATLAVFIYFCLFQLTIFDYWLY